MGLCQFYRRISMMNPKLLHNLIWIPLFLIGFSGAVLGILWLTVDEPWLVDKMVYRFFGLWLLALGVVVCAYVLITFMGTPRARNTLLIILGILLVFLFYLEYTYIPVSPFLYLTYGLLTLYLVSLWATVRLNKQERSG